MGAIIPALMHRIPSELRSQACSGESSTRMGDLLGSPRVAPLFLGPAGYHSGLPLVVPMGSALPIAIGAGRSSIWSPDRKLRGPSKSHVWDFSPFSAAWKILSLGDDRRKRLAFWTVEAKVMGGNAWWRGWVP